MNKVLIAGYGVVGKNLHKEIEVLQPEIIDPKYSMFKTDEKTYDFGFICVDTPLGHNGRLNTEQVEKAIQEYECDIYVIKSTVPVGWTENYSKKSGKRLVVSPEYYGNTPHCQNYNFDFTIIGGEKKDCVHIQQLLQEVYDARHVFRIVDSKVAEMCKLMENSFLATKVTFCNQFYEACKRVGIDYEDVREIFILDERCGSSHTYVYRDHPYYDSHCLNKDVQEAMNSMELDFIKSVYTHNEKTKKTILLHKKML